MSDKCTHENLTWLASVDVWKCSDCMEGLSKQEVICIKSKQLKETQEQLEALKAENEKLILEQAQDDYNHDSLLELTRMQERHIQQQAAQFDRAKKKIESLKADKAKVEAEAIRKATLHLIDYLYSENPDLVYQGVEGAINDWFLEYASQLETKGQKEG